MTVIGNEVRKGFYLDSVALMRISRAIAALPGVEVVVPEASFVGELAGRPELYEAAAWLAGSFAAVEAIKRIVQVGQPVTLSASFSLATETD